MKEVVTRSEVQAWLKEYFKDRREFGLGKAILAMVLEPANPFEPKRPRSPRKAFVLFAVWLLGVVGVFVYFNLWS